MGGDHMPVVSGKKLLSDYIYAEKKGKQQNNRPSGKRKPYKRPIPAKSEPPKQEKQLSDEELADLWNTFDVNKALDSLKEDQRALALHALNKDYVGISFLQHQIVSNNNYKILAVRHVTQNANTPGVDHVMWRTASQKMKAALSLTKEDYKASPLKTFILTGRNGKERIIGIPTLKDRSMQTLYDYALAPVTDTWSDKTSYAFRPGRSLQDAIYAVRALFNGPDMPSIVVKTDVTAFYASVQQAWLLENAPMDKDVLSAFLSCGQIFPGELFPRYEDGISLGCPLSPRLANFILDGLQQHIRHYLTRAGRPATDYPNGAMVRYADDIIVAARDKNDAELILSAIKDFFEERGLTMSENKTDILDLTKQTFTFLSCTFRKSTNCVRIVPSEETIYAIEASCKEYITTGRHSQRTLILGLNKKLTGWSSFFRYTDATDAFKKVDCAIQALLLKYLIDKYPKLSNQKIIERFWYEDRPGHFVFSLADDKTIRLMELKDVLLMTHDLPYYTMKYYINREYFEEREHSSEARYVHGKYKSVLSRQGQCCAICKRPILPDQRYTIMTADITKKDSVKNTQYVHTLCSTQSVIRHYVTEDISEMTPTDVLNILRKVNKRRPDDKRPVLETEMTPTWRHYELKKYIAGQNAPTLRLKFTDIEVIEKRPLPKTAYSFTGYWYHRPDRVNMAAAWESEGYRMTHLDLEKETVELKRTVDDRDHLHLPKWLSEDKMIPKDARNEIEKFLAYIGEKYSL